MRLQLEPVDQLPWPEDSARKIVALAQGGVAGHENRIGDFSEEVPEMLVARDEG